MMTKELVTVRNALILVGTIGALMVMVVIIARSLGGSGPFFQ